MTEEQDVIIEADGEAFLRMCRVVSKGKRGSAWSVHFTGWEGNVGLRIGRDELQIPATVSRPFSATLNLSTVRALVQAKDPALCARVVLTGKQATLGLDSDLRFEVRALDLDQRTEAKEDSRIADKRIADACLNRAAWAKEITRGLQGQAVPDAVSSVEAASEALHWLGVQREDVVAMVKRVRKGNGRLQPPMLPFPPGRGLF